MIFGFLLGSVVTDQLGSVYVFIICSCLSALGLLFGLVRIENIVPDNNVKSEDMEDDNAKGRGKKKSTFLGKSPKLWVGGGQES